MAIKYTNIFHCKTLQSLPKLEFLVWKQTIRQPWTRLTRTGFRDQLVEPIDILVNRDGEHCQDKLSIFGEKENKKLNVLHGKMYFSQHSCHTKRTEIFPKNFVLFPI
jgi:hypothetical protein